MRRNEIVNGLWAAMITPYTADNKIDYKAVEQIIDWYAQHGVKGIFSVCQSSEMHFLSLEERVSLASFVVEKTPKDMGVVISGHISDSIEDQKEELLAMSDIGADALILTSNRFPSEESEWKRSCEQMLHILPEDLPLGIYECPVPNYYEISPSLLKWCAETDRFVFLKDVCCKPEHIRAKKEAVKGHNLKVFTADTATTLASLNAGADGYCGIMANFIPETFSRLCDEYITNPSLAQYLQNFGTQALMIADLMYPVCAKYCMQLEGIPTTLVTRNRDYVSFSSENALYAQQIHNFWKEFEKKLFEVRK